MRADVGDPPPLPVPVNRTLRDAAARASFSVTLETTTPILGGAAVTRQIDTVDVIRVPTIRGHLRFWWRALYGGQFATAKELFDAEAALWGRAADEHGGRTAVEIAILVQQRRQIVADRIEITAPDSYALWPARQTQALPTAPRRSAGVRFQLTASAPKANESEIRNALRAWILFGGYGSRTRRGVGSLTVATGDPQRRRWLPSADEPEDLKEALTDLFNAPGASRSFPSVRGSTLLVGEIHPRDAQAAWTDALGWLRRFRQGNGVGRDPGAGHPGLSRWPEADKLRHLTGRPGHPPRYTDPTPAWPRADFGLPIVGKFQGGGEPPDFELTWQNPNGEIQDRMASPVIVKALPTLEGFRPCVLWLSRSNPAGQVVARRTDWPGKPLIAGSAAGFSYVGSAADQRAFVALGSPLARQPSVRDAFVAFVLGQAGVVQVAP